MFTCTSLWFKIGGMKPAKILLLLAILSLTVLAAPRLIYREILSPTTAPFYISKKIPTANYQRVRVLVQRTKAPSELPIPPFHAQVMGTADGVSFKILDLPEGQLSSTAVVDMPPEQIGVGIEADGSPFEVIVWGS